MLTNMRRGGVRIDILVAAAIVAVGTVAAGITDDPHPDVAAIPGCDVVLPAQEGFSFYSGAYGGEYDNPDYPWQTAEKASAMSEALVRSLPSDVELQFASPSNSLIFQPMLVYSKNAKISDGVTVEDISGDSTASGIIDRAGITASLRVSAEASKGEVPPCTEGQVDERTTLPDGTVVDVRDSVSQYNGVATHSRTAFAYFLDTVVSARTSNDGADAALPLNVDELLEMASNPELRITAAVPEETAPARMDCGSARENPVYPLPRDVVERLGVTLQAQWNILFPNARTDIPVGDLLPGAYGSGSACNAVEVTTPTGTVDLTVDVSVQEDKWWHSAESTDEPGVSRATRPDGTIVTQRSDMRSGASDATEWLSVLRPSNTLVQFSFGKGMDVNSLIELASAAGLDL